jgi:hypothetical protein
MLSRHPVCAVLIASLTLGGCGSSSSGKPVRRAKQRVFVLGFDGMDPTLARKWMDEGKLPNLKRLSEQGTFAKLETTQPSESPVAWASFATGVNPGKHNIYDFPEARPADLPARSEHGNEDRAAVFKWGFLPVKRPEVLSTRGGTLVLEARVGGRLKSVVLTVPMNWPRTRSSTARSWAGFLWATSAAPGHVQLLGHRPQLLRGRQHRVRRLPQAPPLRGGRGPPLLKGPDNPILKQEERELQARQKAGSLSDAETKASRRAGDHEGGGHPVHRSSGRKAPARRDRAAGHAVSTSRPATGAPGSRSPSSSTRS